MGIILVCYRYASIVFDHGSTLSDMFTYFSFGFDVMCEPLAMPVHVSTLIRDSLGVD